MKKPRPVCYVSGKFTDKTPEDEHRNCQLAVIYARFLWRMGYRVIIPHTMSGIFDTPTAEKCGVGYEDFMALDLWVLERTADVMFMLPNWRDSRGALREKEFFTNHLGKPIFFTLGEARAWLEEHRSEFGQLQLWQDNG